MSFHEWLKKELNSIGVDIGIYCSYLIGILEDNIEEDEKREMISDIVSALVENDTEPFVTAIFEQWNASNGAPAQTSSNGVVKKIEEVDIAKLLETQAKIVNQSVKQKPQQSDEEKRIKQQILANYSQSTVKEEEEEEEQGAVAEIEDDPDLEKNTNKADVQKLAREKREQARVESAAKKIKDKEDRAKQKATREDKKSARKERAVKGERKR